MLFRAETLSYRGEGLPLRVQDVRQALHIYVELPEITYDFWIFDHNFSF